ncbi:hypothetical protein [Limisphaera sp. 4302-co]|uniref:hypothetical protein n=1 Tax=Limisphaera sp. 4302-co TaxID=3400417 RepID=UPI003C1D40D6
MDGAVTARISGLRGNGREWSRLGRAFALSLLLHLLLYAGYRAARHWDLPSDWLLPRKLRYVHQLKRALAEKEESLNRPEQPLVFVEVSPRQTVEEPPPDTPYYSDRNARAANREAERETGQPQLTGVQEVVPKTEEGGQPEAKDEYEPLRPAVARPVPAEAPPPSPPLQVPAEPRPEGDVAVVQPEAKPPVVGEGPQAPSRPRTLAEARARRGLDALPGERMRQEGGVRARLEFESLDVKATPFGDYDAAFVRAVADRWYALLDAKRYAGYQRGKVVVRFLLHSDGRVTDLEVVESTVGLDLSLLCEMAVLDPAPYAPWPIELRRLVQGGVRKVQFTFYYN